MLFIPSIANSIVQKLVPPKFKRSVKDYLALYRSGHVKKRKKERLTEKAIRYVIWQRQKGKSPSDIAVGRHHLTLCEKAMGQVSEYR